jgi:hypothetical protein
MPFDKTCLIQARELVDTATAVKNFKSLDGSTQDKIIGELTGDAIKKEWNSKKIREMAAEYIINGYLTAPTNIATNIGSALSQTIMAPLVREATTLAGKLTGTAEGRRFGEGLSMLRAAVKNFGERLDFFKAGYTRGFPLDVNVSAKSFGIDEKTFKDYTDKLGLNQSESILLKQELYDTYGNRAIPGLFGKALSQGARAGVGIDEANKAMFRRMEYDALAYRMAPALAKREGISEAEALKKLEIGNLTPDDWQATIRQKLAQMGFESPEAELIKLNRSTKQLVFQGEAGKLLGKLTAWRAENPLLGALTVPFLKTPAMILNEGVAYVPLIGAMHRRAVVDPKTGQFMGTDFAMKIPSERPEFVAKQALGVAATLYVNSLVDQGLLTGSEPTGDKPKYSVKIGDTWYGYGRIEPLATVVGLAVDLHETVNKYKRDPLAGQDGLKDIQKYGGLYLKAIGDNITQKSFMEGFAKMFAAVVEPERNAKNFLESYATALVPAGVAAVARTIDPLEREVTGFLDKVKSRTPGMREELPPKFDITGQPTQRSLGEVWLGIKAKTPNAIQTALEESGYVFTPSDKKIKGVELSTEQLAEYRRLAGNYFAAVVNKLEQTPQFKQADMSMKDLILQQQLAKARSAASDQLVGTLFATDEKFRNDYIMQMRIKKGQTDQLLREQGRQQ